MDDPLNDVVRSRTPRWITFALVASLGLNLLIIFAVVGVGRGAFVEGRPDREMSQDMRRLGIGPLGAALSRQDRQELLLLGNIEVQDFHAQQRLLRAATGDFARALRAEPFDREGAQAALETMRMGVEALQLRGHGLLLDQLEAMSPDARADVADRVGRRFAGNRP
jgi:uncharacterized membrane protein